jgi:hypothetical protein
MFYMFDVKNFKFNLQHILLKSSDRKKYKIFGEGSVKKTSDEI